jgi:hypothetical protein
VLMSGESRGRPEGIGKNHLVSAWGKGRGIKSYLFKAHNRALLDLASGKQQSILGALRAHNSLGGCSK